MRVETWFALALVLIASPALAGGFDHYDKNADGYISAEELGEEKAHKMTKLDTDGDERISREEFEAYKAKKHKEKRDDKA